MAAFQVITEDKSDEPSDPRIRCPCAAGRPARMTAGLAPAGTSGKRSIPGESARRAFTSGLRRSASSAAAGRRIQTGIRNDEKMTVTYLAIFQLAVQRRRMRQSHPSRSCRDLRDSRVCPACLHHWTSTQCPKCGGWSPPNPKSWSVWYSLGTEIEPCSS